jgi:hypothetical protein
MNTLLAEFTNGDYEVKWYISGKAKKIHKVEYGLQIKKFDNNLEACHEFGECVLHSLGCAGKLD